MIQSLLWRPAEIAGSPSCPAAMLAPDGLHLIISNLLIIHLSFSRFLFSCVSWSLLLAPCGCWGGTSCIPPPPPDPHTHMSTCRHTHTHTHEHWKQRRATCQRWSQPQRCGHCSGGRVNPWPEECHPGQRPSGGRRRQLAIHSTLQG